MCVHSRTGGVFVCCPLERIDCSLCEWCRCFLMRACNVFFCRCIFRAVHLDASVCSSYCVHACVDLPVIGQYTVGEDKPAALVALQIVGPLEQPALHFGFGMRTGRITGRSRCCHCSGSSSSSAGCYATVLVTGHCAVAVVMMMMRLLVDGFW